MIYKAPKSQKESGRTGVHIPQRVSNSTNGIISVNHWGASVYVTYCSCSISCCKGTI